MNLKFIFKPAFFKNGQQRIKYFGFPILHVFADVFHLTQIMTNFAPTPPRLFSLTISEYHHGIIHNFDSNLQQFNVSNAEEQKLLLVPWDVLSDF